MAEIRSESDRLAEQAAVWLVQRSGDDPAERARVEQAFAAWKAADPRHAQAAASLEAVVDQVEGVRHSAAGNPRPAHAALDAVFNDGRRRRRAGRQRLGGVLVLALAMAVPVGLAVSEGTVADLWADVRSSETDWVSRTLPDGTRITLSGRTAIDLKYDPQQRTVRLLRGDIRVDVAKDAERPFYVETPVARIRALGTRFAVSYESGSTDLEMFESTVSVQALADHEATTLVHAGERLQLTRRGAGLIEGLDAERVEQGWQHRQLVLNDRPLPEVLAQLARHRPGGIRFDAEELRALRVSAVLPLDKPDEALQLLSTIFPELRLRTLAGRWVWVDVATDHAKN